MEMTNGLGEKIQEATPFKIASSHIKYLGGNSNEASERLV